VAGIAGKDLACFEVADGEHNEASWASRIGEMLIWLFPAKKEQRPRHPFRSCQ